MVGGALYKQACFVDGEGWREQAGSASSKAKGRAKRAWQSRTTGHVCGELRKPPRLYLTTRRMADLWYRLIYLTSGSSLKRVFDTTFCSVYFSLKFHIIMGRTRCSISLSRPVTQRSPIQHTSTSRAHHILLWHGERRDNFWNRGGVTAAARPRGRPNVEQAASMPLPPRASRASACWNPPRQYFVTFSPRLQGYSDEKNVRLALLRL